MYPWRSPSQLGAARAFHVSAGRAERYSYQNRTHIRAVMDKLQARFKLAS